ncbi:MAG: tyrosine-type recombinase/integrase, partial [Planctomycetota bacterium]
KLPSGRTAYVTRSVANKKEGEELLKEIRLSILRGTFAPAPPEETTTTLTLVAAIDEYLKAKEAAGAARRGLQRYATSRRVIALSPIAHSQVVDLLPRDVETYMAWRRQRKWRGVRKKGNIRSDPNVIVKVKGEKVSNSSVNRDVALISAALGRLVRLGQLEKNVAKRVKLGREPVKSRVVLSKEECAKVIDACAPHFRPLALAALLTGQRPSELMALTWGDINFGNKTISVFRTKVGLGDSIPLHPALAEELKGLKKSRATKGKRTVHDDEPVFLSARGRPNWEYRWAWKKALQRAGLARRKGLTFYSLRHAFATFYLERGTPSDLQALLGHASYSTTERYVRSMSDRARVSVEALDVLGV